MDFRVMVTRNPGPRSILGLTFASLMAVGTCATVNAVVTPAWITQGTQSGDHYGQSVARAGDVNGDGFDDVIVGAHLFGNSVSVGRIQVFLGSNAGLATAPVFVKDGAGGVSWYGFAVSSAGDVNGDGFDDVIAGAPRFRAPRVDEGRAFLYYGSSAGISGGPAWVHNGGQEDARFGTALASIGDVNGDGFGDLAIGAPLFDGLGLDGGRVEVFYGSASGLATTADLVIEGAQNTQYLGSSVAGAGDVNHDGFDDLMIGSNGYGNGAADEGLAAVYLGSASGLSNVPFWTVEGDNVAYGGLGSSVASAGDVNGDGFVDVIVGAPEHAFDNFGRAYLYVGNATGLENVAAWTFTGQANTNLGVSVAGAGDVNQDGFADFMIGGHGTGGPGRADLYLGSSTVAFPAPFLSFSDGQVGDRLGASVSSAGDVDGDGLDDFLVGAPMKSSDTESAVGAAFGFLGQDLFTTDVPALAQSASDLAAPSPNPLRDVTTLSYRLSSSAPATLFVCDANGRQVLRRALDSSIGLHEWMWDGASGSGERLTSGVYWISIESGGRRSTRSIVISR